MQIYPKASTTLVLILLSVLNLIVELEHVAAVRANTAALEEINKSQ